MPAQVINPYVVEPVQAEGGMIVPPVDYLPAAQ